MDRREGQEILGFSHGASLPKRKAGIALFSSCKIKIILDETSEMIIEFPLGEEEGLVYAAGRAEDIFSLPPSLCRGDISWRKPLSWEEDLWRGFPLPSARERDGSAMLGEGGTLFHWDESRPHWVTVESEEEEEILALEGFPWAHLESACLRPDCRTMRFLLPAPLLQIRKSR